MLVDDIVTFLQANSEIFAQLTGGIHQTVEISRQLTPAAFDANKEIKPSALVKAGTETAVGPFDDSVQTPFVIYLYQRSGYEDVLAAEHLIFVALHRKKVGAATWMIMYDSTLYNQYDDA